jgi:threonine synthase
MEINVNKPKLISISHLECSNCLETYSANALMNLCPHCGKPFFVRYDLEAVKKNVNRDGISTREPTLWRYEEILPIMNIIHKISLGEGFTPLIKAHRLGELLNLKNLYIKNESQNPTGSFKDRGMSVAVSRAIELGISKFCIPSAGNAASSLSAYAALSGTQAHVFMPEDVSRIFITECKNAGASVTLVKGTIADAGIIAAEFVEESNSFNISTLREPYRLEGKKTMGYEIAEQLGWKLPDVIIYPTGGGTGLVGMWKSFDEMEKLGWIDERRPRMVAVQSTGCAPIVEAFNNKFNAASPWKNAKTIAEGLRVPSAVGDFLILKALYESEGIAISVDDKEIIHSIKIFGHYLGILPSPEGAATLAALNKLLKIDWIKPEQLIVLFQTGTGLKYTHLLNN